MAKRTCSANKWHKDREALVLDRGFIDRTCKTFMHRYRHSFQSLDEARSLAADFILTTYKIHQFDMKKAKKADRMTALQAHAAISLYRHFTTECQRACHPKSIPAISLDAPNGRGSVLQVTYTSWGAKAFKNVESVIPEGFLSHDPILRIEAQEEARHRLAVLDATLEFDDDPRAVLLRRVLASFEKKDDLTLIGRSIGCSAAKLAGLFRWARKRYSSFGVSTWQSEKQNQRRGLKLTPC